MNKFFKIILASFVGLWSAPAFSGDISPLITPLELASMTESPLILDIRAKGFRVGHIEGAVAAPYNLFRGPAENPGQVPPTSQLEAIYETSGLEPSSVIVIVSHGNNDTDFGAAARVYWTLKSSGFTELSVLNGGMLAWTDAGLPLTKAVITPKQTQLDITWDDTWSVSTEEITQMASGEIHGKLIDARTPAFFMGEKAHKAAGRPGTLPRAQNLPHTKFFNSGTPVLKHSIDVASLKSTLGIEAGDAVVSFCNTGHWAATDWFAISEVAGIENVKLYPGSMVEYSQTNGEMKNQPSIIRNLLNKLTGKS